MKKYVLAAAVTAVVASPSLAMACAACGCNLDTDEAAIVAGWTVDERIDYVNQNKLWLGGAKAPPQDPTALEVQRNTTTVFYTTTMDYQSESRWGVTLAVPAEYRTHSSYNNGTVGDLSKSEWSALGDLRLLGRYAVTDDRWFNLLGGLKLPTGGTTHNFDSGTTTAGTLVDRGLQPGSGTWDLLLGFGQNGKITESLGWFAQELWQRPLTEHNGFAEGQKLNASIGMRYTINELVTPQFQFNAQNRWRDHGDPGVPNGSDPANSGGEVIYASPGLFLNVRDDTALYGFVQIPIYQRTGGLELVPAYSASVGAKYKF